jgi:hypothetical protein
MLVRVLTIKELAASFGDVNYNWTQVAAKSGAHSLNIANCVSVVQGVVRRGKEQMTNKASPTERHTSGSNVIAASGTKLNNNKTSAQCKS